MNLLKIFFLNISFFIISSLFIHADVEFKYYRSNSNGLELLEISNKGLGKYEYILRSQISNNLPQRKILYKDNKEIKRWDYFYTGGRLSYEIYYKDNVIKEDYRYDPEGHIIKKSEYKNGDKIRVSNYQYNNDGLVGIEKVSNLINNDLTIIKYRYDSKFKIKQIEKKFPDERLVYWEAFFTDKGIIQREYYTLKSERFVFWYNEYGQEFKGEVLDLSEGKDNIKKEWQTFYTKKGKIERKEEINYESGLKINTWYNSDYK